MTSVALSVVCPVFFFTVFLDLCHKAALIIIYLGVTGSGSPGVSTKPIALPPSLEERTQNTLYTNQQDQ